MVAICSKRSYNAIEIPCVTLLTAGDVTARAKANIEMKFFMIKAPTNDKGCSGKRSKSWEVNLKIALYKKLSESRHMLLIQNSKASHDVIFTGEWWIPTTPDARDKPRYGTYSNYYSMTATGVSMADAHSRSPQTLSIGGRRIKSRMRCEIKGIRKAIGLLGTKTATHIGIVPLFSVLCPDVTTAGSLAPPQPQIYTPHYPAFYW